MSFFPKAPKVPKLWRPISFSNQIFFENVRAITYILENIFPMVYHTLQLDLV
jgi:hypothetical protein